MNASEVVAPAKVNRDRLRRRHVSQTEMQFRAALTRVAVARVYLRYETLSVRQMQGGGCADGVAAQQFRSGMARGDASFRGACLSRRKQQIEL